MNASVATNTKADRLISELSKGVGFPLVVDQIAFLVKPEFLETAKALCGAMGHKEWAVDFNKATGTVFGQQAKVEGQLHFSYSFLNIKPDRQERGLEYEILCYDPANTTPDSEGYVYDNWHASRARREGELGPIHLSHIGFHLPSEEALQKIRTIMLDAGFDIAQEVHTVSHSNEFLLKEQRKYHYLIFDSVKELGADFKFISRIQ